MFNILRNCQTVLQIVTIKPEMYEVSNFSTSSLKFGIVYLCDYGHSSAMNLIAIIISIFLMTNDVEHLLICLLTIPMFSLVKCLFKFLPILKWVVLLNFKRVLYILVKNPL